jgi:hypothetical protein
MSSPFRFDVGIKISDVVPISIKRSRKAKVKSIQADIPVITKKPTQVKSVGFTEILDRGVILALPIRTISEGNCFEPWQKKHKRHKSQKLQIKLALLPIKCKIKLPCHIKLIRYAPRTLDKHDNLPMSFKFLVDAICEEITGNYVAGRADDSDQISIVYDQVKSKEYFIKIEISF